MLGVERTAQFNTRVWSNGDSVEQSWLNFNADETATVVISLVSGSITSAKVVPEDKGHTMLVSGGTLTLTVPQNVQLRVVIVGDEANTLHLISSPLKPALAAASIDWDDVVQPIVAVEGNGQITVTGHGFTGSVDLIFINGGTLPTVTLGTLEVREPIACTVVDADTIQIVGVEFGDEGTGQHYIAPAAWADTDTELRFPAGVHELCRGFWLGRGTSIYIDEGAVLRGSLDVSDSRGIAGGCVIRGGGGVLAPVYTYEEVAALPQEDRFVHSAIYGGTGSWSGTYDVTVQGIGIVNTPFYSSTPCVRYWTNCFAISPWCYTTDGFKTQSPVTIGAEVGAIDCYAYVGDDAFYFQRGAPVFRRCLAAVTANGCFHGGYFPRDAAGTPGAQIIDCDAIYLGTAHPTLAVGGSGVIKAMIDGLESETALGTNLVTVSDLKVWGENAGALVTLGNIPYPYSFPSERDQNGQLNNWTIDGLWAQKTPGQKSPIVGLNGANTPHDITFSNLQIGGIDVYDDNFEDFFDVGVYPYRINWDARPEPEPEAEPVLTETEALHEAMLEAPDVASYTTATGVSVTRRSVDEMMKLDRYLREKQARARGLRQTRVRFR